MEAVQHLPFLPDESGRSGAEKFDRSHLFGVGLAFLPMLFFPLLVLGGSQYRMEFTFSEEPEA